MALSTCPPVCPEMSGRPLLSCSWVSASSNRPLGHTSTFYKHSSYSLLFPGGAGPGGWLWHKLELGSSLGTNCPHSSVTDWAEVGGGDTRSLKS